MRDVFRTRDMRNLQGVIGIAHCRYPTAGSADNSAESQPLYVNSPFGIVLGHNGNLTNAEQLKRELFRQDLRHVNTNSDSEVLLNVLAHELQEASASYALDPATIFQAVSGVHRRCRGAYAVMAMIAGYGLLAFRDPYGIRPLVFGARAPSTARSIWSPPRALRSTRSASSWCATWRRARRSSSTWTATSTASSAPPIPSLNPCIFEYVYLARPDSVIDGISVYETRLRMGESLAQKIAREHADLDIDVVIPIPDSSRPSAMQLAQKLDVAYREGFIKNRYIGRTFIMPGQAVRKKSVRQKLNAIGMEFKGKNVLLVDDSIVRGTTSREIVQMARDAGANKVYFASAAPPVRFPNVYGIDMPSPKELIANGRSPAEIAREIGADCLIYQDLDALIEDVRSVNPKVQNFETSCFSGVYITGDVTPEYLAGIEATRNDSELARRSTVATTQLDLNLVEAD